MRPSPFTHLLRVASLAATSLLLCSPAPAAELPVTDVLRGHLLRAGENGLVPAPEAEDAALGKRRLVALYFSADWCPPCHVFTPKLVNFYRAVREKHPEFEVVFVSRDNSDAEMLKYLRESGMPFPAVRFADLLGFAPALANAGGESLPSLILLDANTGRLLAGPVSRPHLRGPREGAGGAATPAGGRGRVGKAEGGRRKAEG